MIEKAARSCKRSAQTNGRRRADGSPKGQDARATGGLVHNSPPRKGHAKKISKYSLFHLKF